ncbi:MAG: hypothetical protein J6T22_13345, partial [Bacteroidales bacterium]|nr:hypothetical protein [Bacteroidales bacterium]
SYEIKATDIFGYIYKAQHVIKNTVAMSTQSKPFSFKGQKIFVGLDVHGVVNLYLTILEDLMALYYVGIQLDNN